MRLLLLKGLILNFRQACHLDQRVLGLWPVRRVGRQCSASDSSEGRGGEIFPGSHDKKILGLPIRQRFFYPASPTSTQGSTRGRDGREEGGEGFRGGAGEERAEGERADRDGARRRESGRDNGEGVARENLTRAYEREVYKAPFTRNTFTD